MSKVKFTPEQQDMLRSNQYTVRVTANTLSLSKEFKELFYQELLGGSIPRDILRKYGYPVEILGKERIWGITHCIRKEYEKKGAFTDILSPSSAAALKPEDEIRRLQQQVDYLTQEVEFLKKISSIRNTRK